MKKILLAVIAISVTLLFSSCVGLTNITAPQTVALNQGNFRFVKSVNAEVEALYIFGFGGIRDRANEDIVENLRLKAKLKSNQALADIRIKTTTKSYIGIVTKRTLMASATVVEFKDSVTNAFVETDAEFDEEIPNLRLDENNQIYIEGRDELSTRKLEYERLKIINRYLKNGYTEGLNEINSEVDRISKWYNSISATYPEIHNILKEIKKLL